MKINFLFFIFDINFIFPIIFPFLFFFLANPNCPISLYLIFTSFSLTFLFLSSLVIDIPLNSVTLNANAVVGNRIGNYRRKTLGGKMDFRL